MPDTQNYFGYKTAAERYARGRPYFHPLVIKRIREYLGLEAPVARALDVACGTGQSALALTEIAETVTGTDLSPEMLAQAIAHPRIEYRQAAAEAIPLPDAYFDLITASLAFHWFNRDRFFAEANRLLLPGGWLVIYNSYFSGAMRENPAYKSWNDSSYLMRFPTPSRHNQPLTDSDAARYGFRFAHRETFTNGVRFTTEGLANYLMTQSNVIAVLEQGEETEASVKQWLLDELAPLMEEQTGTFPFNGYIWFLQAQ